EPAVADVRRTAVPPDAMQIRVSHAGFEPASLNIPAGQALKVAFTRDSGPNCGSEVVFPSLAIRRPLPLGATVVVELPAQPAGEIRFGCGMGMYRGMIVAK